MKILAVADIHGTEIGKEIISRSIASERPDLLAICGDITHFGPAKAAFDILSSVDIPTVAVNGNCDPPEVGGMVDECKTIALAGRCEIIDGIKFCGIGYPVLDEHLCAEHADVIVTHLPPKGFNDFVEGAGNVGDEKILWFVEKVGPRLVLSGHIHEAPGVMESPEIGTIFVNPGPACDGYLAIVDIAENSSVRPKVRIMNFMDE